MVSILHVWQRHRRLHVTYGMVWLLLMALPILVCAEQFAGKVVGISDGDTISVLRAGKAVKVRLYGIDAPEKAQAFGTKARQFTATLVFQKDVTVIMRATDLYGRIVGEVLLPDGRSLSQELVKAGMAWWYKPYAAKDTTLAQLEAEARAAKRGLWADAHPMPPWAWRKEKHVASAAGAGTVSGTASAATDGEVHGNRHSKVYRVPGCRGYTGMNPVSVVPFATEADAQQAGYRKAKDCP
jgi:endonuclease YncB( thermonuclease family)